MLEDDDDDVGNDDKRDGAGNSSIKWLLPSKCLNESNSIECRFVLVASPFGFLIFLSFPFYIKEIKSHIITYIIEV
jgi:hypothetical protein